MQKINRLKKALTKAWGANALAGHVIMGMAGLGIVAIDILYFVRFPSIETMMGFSAFVIFPPLLLSAQGMDKRTETVPSFILTFATSVVFGIFIGALILAGFIPVENGQKVQTLSTFVTLIIGISICVSYWTVGQMSRNQVDATIAVWGGGNIPPNTQAFICLLKLEQEHSRARKLVENLVTLRHGIVVAEGGLLDQAVEILCADPSRDDTGRAEIKILTAKVRVEISGWVGLIGANGANAGERNPSALRHLTGRRV